MNIEDAKKIPIELLAERLGAVLKKQPRQWELWFLSPFRDEKTASFKIDTRTNRFKDFSDNRGQGDIIDLWCDFHNRDRKDKEAIKEALQALQSFSNIPYTYRENKEHIVTYSNRYKIVSRSEKITAKALKDEAARRRIPIALISDFMDQALVEDTETRKKFYAFAMDNDKDGVELTGYDARKNLSFKNCVGPKAPTSFKAHHEAQDVTAFIFSSKWDFLTWVQINGRDLNSEYVIYHGDGLTTPCADYLITRRPAITKAMHFKHMDNSGEQADAALALLLEPEGFAYGSMEHLYTGQKDLNDAWMRQNSPIMAYSRDRQRQVTYRPRQGLRPGL